MCQHKYWVVSTGWKGYKQAHGAGDTRRTLTAMIQGDCEWYRKERSRSSFVNIVSPQPDDPPGVESDYVRDGNLTPRLHAGLKVVRAF
jgi:ATP-dependent phosphoenolpyruvate carboxykinase